MSSTLNIVVPMAGRGSRFADAGYANPKPLIDVLGYPMIQYVIGNLSPSVPHRFVFIVQREHQERYQVSDNLKKLSPGCEVVEIDGITEGAACTVLLAREFFDSEDPLMIANSDQWVDVSIDSYLARMDGKDGLIMTMTADHPKWSYCRLDADQKITEVVEKQVVSNEATVGIYNFKSGKAFTKAAESMIAQNLRVNNEFYVAPAYNEMIKEGAVLDFYNIGSEYDGMYGLGTPEDLTKFLSFEVASKARDMAAACSPR